MRLLSRTRQNFLVIGGSTFWVPDRRQDGTPNSFASRTVKPLEVRHTVFIYHDGNLLLEYDKRNSANEVPLHEQALGYRFVPGQVLGRFTCGTLQCGVETCVDQDMGELQRTGTGRFLDLHFVVSNCTNVQKPAARQGGYVIHCDANQNERMFLSGVYRWPHDGSGRVPPVGLQAPLLSYYEVDI